MTTINEVHCQECGSTDTEDVGFQALVEGDGYTACCNQRAIYPTDLGDGINWVTGRQITKPWSCEKNGDCQHD